MKVIFLDIDGVLNSFAYRKRMGMQYYSEIIDREKMPLLKRIVEATDARIVLSTSWRKFWKEKNPQTDAIGQYINDVFAQFGLWVHSKTPVMENAGRNAEIEAWLANNRSVEGYVILDDKDFGWSSPLRAHFVRTDLQGDGLEESQIQQATDVLNGNLFPVREKREEETHRCNNSLCRYCGGAMKGLFRKRCVVCGKRKDDQ